MEKIPQAILLNKKLILFLACILVITIVLTAFHGIGLNASISKKTETIPLSSESISDYNYSDAANFFNDLPSSYQETDKIKRYQPPPSTIAVVPAPIQQELHDLKNKQLELQQELMQFRAKSSEIDERLNSQNQQAKNSSLFFSSTGDANQASESEQKNNLTYEIQTGTIIAAVLLTGVNTAFPGNVIAQVRYNIYDTATGKYLLIPKGSKLFGQYDARVFYGQKRVLLAFNRLIRPDGISVLLNQDSSVDLEGRAGIEAKVNNHWSRLFATAALSTLLGVGTGSLNYRIASTGALDEIADIGQQIFLRALDVQPTLVIAGGLQFNIIVQKDITLTPFIPNL